MLLARSCSPKVFTRPKGKESFIPFRILTNSDRCSNSNSAIHFAQRFERNSKTLHEAGICSAKTPVGQLQWSHLPCSPLETYPESKLDTLLKCLMIAALVIFTHESGTEDKEMAPQRREKAKNAKTCCNKSNNLPKQRGGT